MNPELGLQINGQSHLIKLYFKAKKLSKTRIDIITHSMDATLSRFAPPHTCMSVLDVRHSKLISPTVPIEGLDAMLVGELAYIAAVWPGV